MRERKAGMLLAGGHEKYDAHVSREDQLCTGPEIIICYGLREIGQFICVLFTHRRQLNAIFSPIFTQLITSNNFGPSTEIG